MEIDGLGPAIVEKLIDEGLVKTCADLYELKKRRYSKFGGIR